MTDRQMEVAGLCGETTAPAACLSIYDYDEPLTGVAAPAPSPSPSPWPTCVYDAARVPAYAYDGPVNLFNRRLQPPTGAPHGASLPNGRETGLNYFGARYYSGAQGRFTSPDEWAGGIVDPFTGGQVGQPGPLPYADITDPQTLNKYAYVRNNPLRYVDPDGHSPEEPEDELFVAGMTALGGTIGMYVGGGAGGAGGGLVGAFAGGVGAIPGAAGGGLGGAALGGTIGSGLGYGFGKGLIALSNMLKGDDQQKQQNAQEGHGGGKTGQKQNVDKAQSAKDKFEAAKKEFDQLKAKPNKTKVENQQLDKLKKQVDHWRKKAAEKSEEHARTGQHS